MIALVLIAPFVAIYALVFVYPTIQMFRISFTDAPLIGEGKWVGLDNYARLDSDPLFEKAVWNTAYFVLMTVAPGTLIALLIALGVSRLKGRFQALVLALFFLPYILPVSVVYLIWDWTLNFQFGIAMHVLDWLGIPRVPVFKSRDWFMPAVAWVTIWWTAGFSILLFLAGLRAIPAEIYEAAALDNAVALDDLPAHHLAAALAGDLAGLHHPADPAAQDLRPGLPVLDRRPAERQHGARLLRLPARLPAEPGRPRRRRRGHALRARRRRLGAAVPAAAPRRRRRR